eukprot:PhF_6_TR13878/c0_g1_i1/m.22274/K09669/FUT10; alpha-1,3-fucosyltransferase 10
MNARRIFIVTLLVVIGTFLAWNPFSSFSVTPADTDGSTDLPSSVTPSSTKLIVAPPQPTELPQEEETAPIQQLITQKPGGKKPVVMLPWWASRMQSVTLWPPRCSFSCTYLFRDKDKDKWNLVDAYIVDTLGKMKEDAKIYDIRINPRNLKLILWNVENVFGRKPAWGSKWKIRWLSQANDTKFWESFDMSVSFETGAMIPYLYAPLSFQKEPDLAVFQKLVPHSAKTKKEVELAAFIVSNCWTRHQTNDGFDRISIVKELMSLTTIASYGECLNNQKEKEHFSRFGCDKYPKKQKYCIMAHHPFYISFENSKDVDYVSEKVYEPLQVGVIPVYLGAPNIAEFLPSNHSAILAKDFPSWNHLIRYMKCILKNPRLYNYYTSWRGRIENRNWNRFLDPDQAPLCEICRKLYQQDFRGAKVPRTGGLPPPTTQVIHGQDPLAECVER